MRATQEDRRQDANGEDHFSARLGAFAAMDHPDRVSLAMIAAFLGNGATGTLLLFFALPMVLPIPAPGISVLFGVPLILISAQLLAGMRSLWLPPWLARRSISRSNLHTYVARALPIVRRFETLVRPRLSYLTRSLGLRAVGVVSLLLAAIIALPIPLGHLVPGIAICVMSLGLIERNGIAVLAGFLIGAIALLIVTLATMGLIAAGQTLL